MSSLSIFSASSASIEIVRFKNMVEKDFANIKEYFNGIEDQSYRSVFRTDNSERSGFYFIVKLNSKISDLSPDTIISLEWIPYGELKPKKVSYTIKNRAQGYEILLGLTGTDAPEGNQAPIAWKIDLLNAESESISSEQSFLWK